VSLVEWADYPLFEYEKDLARREINALVGRDVTATNPTVDTDEALRLQKRATFLHTVQLRGAATATAQAQVENLHRTVRGRTTKRQSTRFLVHGLHEYKGKFNPQLARSLVNVVDPSCTGLLDPYCGSGTTLVEGLRLGLDVGGIDKNPLAAWLTKIKIDVLRASGRTDLADQHHVLAAKVSQAMEIAQRRGRAETPAHVGSRDEEYLRHWFPEPVLAALWIGLTICDTERSVTADVVRLTISSLVRSVSWQMPEDLRVRRRNEDWTPPQVSGMFSDASSRANLALREVAGGAPIPEALQATTRCGSSQEQGTVQTVVPGGRRLVVTSPPYATALPYIDTDRLSIILLGLGKASDLRRLEQDLTGSREWNTAAAKGWTAAWRENRDSLPDALLDLLGVIDQTNSRTDAGFRRAAVPALLYRYFSQIGETLTTLTRVLRPGERAVFVVGSNRTGKGTDAINIATPELLGSVAEAKGFDVDEIIPLETWPRYGLHAGNAVNSEEAVVLTVGEQPKG